MKAVILAAGSGTRFGDLAENQPKCLYRIGEASIIERIIRSARDAGLFRIVIVTGFSREAIPAALGDGKRLGVEIEYAYNDRWMDLANGHSIHAARHLLPERFVALMSDHVFDPGLLRSLMNDAPPAGGCLLLTDDRVKEIPDIDDATKVRTDGRRKILAMDKKLTDYDCIDTGIFFSTRGLVDAVAANLPKGVSSLTAANVALAERGLMEFHRLDPRDGAWFDLDTPASVDDFRRAKGA